MKKHSPFTPFIAHAIKKMTEAGINNVLWKRHIESEPNCKPIRAKGTPLGMEKFSSLFVLYSIGCLMSLIILVMEIICKRPKCTENIDEFLFIKIERIQREMQSLVDHDTLPSHLKKEVKKFIDEFERLIPKIYKF